MSEAWIIDACRTPRGIGKPGKGALSEFHPQHLAAAVLKAIAQRNRLDTAEVDDIIWGTSTQRGTPGGDLARTAAQRLPSACGSPRGAQRGCLCACCAGARWCGGRLRQVNRDRFRMRLSSESELLLASKPSGRQIAREPLEDEIWPWRALLAASASRCSSSRSAASARGSR